jgi:hypothetical protein
MSPKSKKKSASTRAKAARAAAEAEKKAEKLLEGCFNVEETKDVAYFQK